MLKTTNKIFDTFNASDYKIGVVTSLFNSEINNQLLDSLFSKADEYKIDKNNIEVYKVAGSVEIPVILQSLARTEKFDCLVALGSVIKGETPHFDYVCKIAAEGINRVSLDFNIPIGFGIITTNNLKQAQARVSSGGSALEAAIQSAKIVKGL